jgi:two-component system sensor histidine kinase RegB
MLPQASAKTAGYNGSMRFKVEPTSSDHEALSRLFWLRNFTLIGLLLLMLWSELGLGVKLPWLEMGITLFLLATLNAFTAWRLKQDSPVREPEILMHLLADLSGLTVLLLFTGGWANPFVSLLFLPVILAALLLPDRLAWLIGALALGAYSLLAYINLPLNIPPEKAFYLHISGMWFNFAASVLLVLFFVLRLRNRLRQRDQELAAFREETLRNEQVLAVALTAASAAHELGTPLNTLALINDSLLASADDATRNDLLVMQSQIGRCKTLLKDLSRTAQLQPRQESLPADHHLRRLVEEWRLLRPDVLASVKWTDSRPAPGIQPPASLDQSLLNLLDNAANVSGERVQLEAGVMNDGLRIDILDTGPGPAPALRAMAEPGKSSKEGLGLGLFLTNASIEHLGGQVSLAERKGGGTCVSVWVPMQRLRENA